MDERERDAVTGVVTAIIFKNEQNGYTVAKARQPDDTEVIVVGVMPFLGCGETISATGVFVSHAQYGSQFQVAACTREKPAETEGIYEYLASRAVRGIGPKTARAIVDTFGAQTFEVLAEHPERLCRIRGISAAKAREIQAEYVRQNAMGRLLELLVRYQLPLPLAATLAETLGAEAETVLRENPYILCGPAFEVDFEQADAMAADHGIEADSPYRLEAALLYVLGQNLQSGHTFVPTDKLLAVAARLCGMEEAALQGRLAVLREQGRVLAEEVAGLEAVYLWQAHSQETFVARDVARLSAMKLKPPPGAGRLLETIEAEQGIDYDPGQRAAVLQCLERGISLITGGPGTGKTTALRACVHVLEAAGMQVALAAPTGRAAKAMAGLCGREAKTIHRLLEAGFDPRGIMQFAKNTANPLAADAVIIDEASMIDLFLAGSLLRALRPHARLVLVGDSDQLPPIGAGSFFADLLAVLPHVRLTEIFRQARGSDIVMNAHTVNRGEIPPLRKNDNDFFFIDTRSPDRTVSVLLTLVTERIPARFGIASADIQVICPARQTACGARVLNRHLQHALNPPAADKAEVQMGEAVFRTGDRVMQVRNNYDRAWIARPSQGGPVLGAGVYNGDIGVIVDIDRAAGLITVAFDERESAYVLDQLDELEHAYAITTHKAQGSEYEAVVVPVFSVPGRLISRNLLYTAITRAKRHLTLVGREDTVAQMIENNRQNRRYSALKNRLRRELNG